jgi:hypothetical protein
MSGEAPAPERLRAGFAAAFTAGVCLVGPAVLGALGVVLTRNLVLGSGLILLVASLAVLALRRWARRGGRP